MGKKFLFDKFFLGTFFWLNFIPGSISGNSCCYAGWSAGNFRDDDAENLHNPDLEVQRTTFSHTTDELLRGFGRGRRFEARLIPKVFVWHTQEGTTEEGHSAPKNGALPSLCCGSMPPTTKNWSFCRFIGVVAGCLSAGKMTQKMNQRLFLGTFLLVMGISVCVAPFCENVSTLSVVVVLHGLSTGLHSVGKTLCTFESYSGLVKTKHICYISEKRFISFQGVMHSPLTFGGRTVVLFFWPFNSLSQLDTCCASK